MFTLFSNSSDQGAPFSENHSTNHSPKETLPGGPSPDSALPWNNEPINKRHPGPATSSEEASTAPYPSPRHSSRHLDMVNSSESQPHGQPLSDAHRENGPAAVANADGPAMESSVGGEARRIESVESRHTEPGRGAIDRASGDDNAFAYGAAATAANAANHPVDTSVQWRPAGAEEDLGQRERPATRFSKEQHGIGRRLSKIIKNESKADQASLDVAVKDLEGLQKLQKASIKEEALSHSRHSRALSDAQKAEIQLLAARTAHERGQASQRATGQALEASRQHVRETTEMLHEKMEEVERLRIQKQMDDTERAVKVKSLVGEERKLFGRIMRS